MKVLLTGGKGMLGRTLCSELREFEMIPTDLPEADITDAAGFDAACRAHSPDVVIHCAAMTAVDKCETEKELAWKLNAVGSSNVAAACHRQGIRLIAISTGKRENVHTVCLPYLVLGEFLIRSGASSHRITAFLTVCYSSSSQSSS